MNAAAIDVSRSTSLEARPETPPPQKPPRLDVQAIFAPQRIRLTKLLRRRGKSPEETEDLVQEAFVRLQIFLNQGNEVREPEAFLVRTTLNLAIDARRRDRRDLYVAEPVEDLNLVDHAPEPEELVAAAERLRKMQETLDTKLNPKTRDIYLRNRLGGYTYQEIADDLQMSVRTVEKHIARAITLLWAEHQKEQQSAEVKRKKV